MDNVSMGSDEARIHQRIDEAHSATVLAGQTPKALDEAEEGEQSKQEAAHVDVNKEGVDINARAQ